MAKNKQTIQQVDTRMEFLFKRLTRTVSELNELRVKRKKMVSGKIKVPPPPGVKHTINEGYTKTSDCERRRVQRRAASVSADRINKKARGCALPGLSHRRVEVIELTAASSRPSIWISRCPNQSPMKNKISTSAIGRMTM